MARKKIYTSDKPKFEAVKAYRDVHDIVRVPLDMPRSERDQLRAYCDKHGLTVAGFIRQLISDAIQAGSVPPGGTGEGPASADCPRK